jgi:hypothetical protein
MIRYFRALEENVSVSLLPNRGGCSGGHAPQGGARRKRHPSLSEQQYRKVLPELDFGVSRCNHFGNSKLRRSTNSKNGYSTHYDEHRHVCLEKKKTILVKLCDQLPHDTSMRLSSAFHELEQYPWICGSSLPADLLNLIVTKLHQHSRIKSGKEFIGSLVSQIQTALRPAMPKRRSSCGAAVDGFSREGAAVDGVSRSLSRSAAKHPSVTMQGTSGFCE